MKTPARLVLTLAGSALVAAGLPAAAHADDVNLTPSRSTNGDPAFDNGAVPFSVAVLPDGSRVLVGTVPDVGRKVVSFNPGPNASQFTIENTVLGNDHGFGSAVGLSFDSSNRLWMADATGPHGLPSINSYAAGFGPGITALTNLAPRLSIAGDYTELVGPADVLLTKSSEIVVADKDTDMVSVFPANTGGNIKPTRTIETDVSDPFGLAQDSVGQIYVTNSSDNSVTVYPANATSATSPIRTIKGPDTHLEGPRKIAVDTSGNIYVTSGDSNSVVVFATGANGNAAPVKRIVGASTGLSSPAGIALDAERRIYVVNLVNSGAGKVLVQFPIQMPFKVPTGARSIKVSGSSKSKSRKISWTTPADTGGAPITKYVVVVKKGSKVLATKTTTGRSFTVSRSKLKDGSNKVYVTAYNRAGKSPVATKTFSVNK